MVVLKLIGKRMKREGFNIASKLVNEPSFKWALSAFLFCLKKTLIVSILCLSVACSNGYQKTPGDDVYYVAFEPDWEVFDSGEFQYGSNRSYQLGGSRGEYNQFHMMHIQFKMKDGREFKETFDMSKLIESLVKNQDVFDVRNTTWGGSASIRTYIRNNEIEIVYEVWERIQIPPYFYSKNYEYPLIKKTLK